MSDISPRRRSIGRWTFGVGAALALPLTATVVYAGQDAPEAPAAPSVPTAPSAPQAPTAPDAPKVHKKIIVMEHRDHKDGDSAAHKMFERRIEKDGKTIVIRSPRPIDEADFAAKVARLEAVEPPEPPLPPAAPGERREIRKIIVEDLDGRGPHGGLHGATHEGLALAMATHGCKDGPTLADADVSHDAGDGERKRVNSTRILLCGKAGETRAAALAGVRRARESIAANREMLAEIRSEVLKELDQTIADMEKESR